MTLTDIEALSMSESNLGHITTLDKYIKSQTPLANSRSIFYMKATHLVRKPLAIFLFGLPIQEQRKAHSQFSRTSQHTSSGHYLNQPTLHHFTSL